MQTTLEAITCPEASVLKCELLQLRYEVGLVEAAVARRVVRQLHRLEKDVYQVALLFRERELDALWVNVLVFDEARLLRLSLEVPYDIDFREDIRHAPDRRDEDDHQEGNGDGRDDIPPGHASSRPCLRSGGEHGDSEQKREQHGAKQRRSKRPDHEAGNVFLVGALQRDPEHEDYLVDRGVSVRSHDSVDRARQQRDNEEERCRDYRDGDHQRISFPAYVLHAHPCALFRLAMPSVHSIISSP